MGNGGNMFDVLFVIITSSFCGGIVFGMITRNSHKLRMPFSGKLIELGFLGDALIGVAAGISVFFIAGTLLNIKLSSMSNLDEQIKVIAISVLSGFAGVRLLTSMSSQLLDKISSVDERLDNIEYKDNVDGLIADGRFHMKNAEEEKESGVVRAELEKSLVAFEEALDIDPKNEAATIEVAKVYRRMNKLSKAIMILQEYVVINPKSSRAYYNMACYKTLSMVDKDKVVADLNKAISLSERYKRLIMLDKDFKIFKDDEDFKKLCE